MAGGTATVLYPQGVKFDMKYYLGSHMPLVGKKWSQYGLKSWKVIEFGDDAQYKVQATLEFGSEADFGKAAGGPETKEVMDDVKNFSDKEPIIIAGKVTGES